jgi:exodeoxyribonuclease VIII
MNDAIDKKKDELDADKLEAEVNGTLSNTKIHKGLSFADYQELHGINHSTLKNVDVSALYYNTVKNERGGSTPAMNLGSAVHSAVLEPDDYKSRYVVFDGKVKRGKAWEEFKLENTGKEIITQMNMNTAIICLQSVVQNTDTARLLQNTENELSLQWRDPETKLDCKCRIDAYDRQAEFLVDLKTTSAKTPYEFIRNAVNYWYHTQLAFYMRGLIANGMPVKSIKIIAVQTVEPFESWIINLPSETIDRGQELVKEWLCTIRDCNRANHFDGFSGQEYDFDLPEWALGCEYGELIVNGEVVKI